MPDIRLTKGNDTYIQALTDKNSGNNIFGEEGDDVLQSYGGNLIGGPGNDTLKLLTVEGEPWRQVIAAYWDGAPGKVVVDLEQGWAQDGWGGRDTLIGVEAVAGGWVENELYGTANANSFWLGGNKNLVDGRGGFDTVNLPWFSNTAPKWEDFTVKVSIDGKSAILTSRLAPQFVANLTNVESLFLWDGSTGQQRLLNEFVTVQDLATGGLVQGASNRWNASGAVGTAVEVSYSFVLNAPASGVGANQFRSFTTNERELVRKILTNLSTFTGLSFKEIDESAGQVGNMRFGVSQQLNSKGSSNFPGEAGDQAGDVWMDVESMLNLSVGSEGYNALLHEIGHALGLRHPRNIDANDHYTMEILPAYDQTNYSAMSQTYSPDGLYRADWGNMDIAALRYLYGSKAVNTGDNTFILNTSFASAEKTLIDDGGVDVIDASASQFGVSIDLLPGHLSSFGITANGIPAIDNLAIAVGSVIENAIGSDRDDYLLGNDADNKLTGKGGNDWIDGGKGTDTAVYLEARNNYFITTAFGKTFIAARDSASGYDTVLNVEKLQFSDQTLTLAAKALGSDMNIVIDLGATQNASLPQSSDLPAGSAQYQLLKAPEQGIINVKSTGEYTYTVTTAFKNNDYFTYSVSDGKGNTNTYTGFVRLIIDAPILNGTAAKDTLVGSNMNDVINGFAGDDMFNGKGGNDVLDGGAGSDTAVFAGKLTDFKISHRGDVYQVVSKSGTEGTDTLSQIENLKFDDMTVNLMVQSLAAKAPAASVQRLIELYVAFFNRVPDADGMAYWIGEAQAGRTINQVADVFYGAGVQFSNLTGFTATMTNTDFINVVYKNVLGRKEGADTDGLNYWNAELTSGSASRGSLVSTILDAAHKFKGNVSWGWVADLLDNKITVARTFAIDWGLGYASGEDAIQHGMEIAALVTPTDSAAALQLVGINALDLNLI